MSGDITVDAVRMALSVSQLRAEVASLNLVNASFEGATHFTVDDTEATRLLEAASGDAPESVRQLLASPASSTMAVVNEEYGDVRPGRDELVADSVAAGLTYQTLSESLSRHFGLMRLAITGRN